MSSYRFSLQGSDFPFVNRKFLCKKLFNRNVAHKTEPLRISTIGIWQSNFFSNRSHFRFCELSKREKWMLKLKLIQPSEKVRLILMVVHSTKEMKHRFSIFFLIFFNSSIVTGRNLVKTLFQSSLQKNIKLDQRITKHIWIRSNPFLIACINIVNNSLLILFLKVKRANFNP